MVWVRDGEGERGGLTRRVCASFGLAYAMDIFGVFCGLGREIQRLCGSCIA